MERNPVQIATLLEGIRALTPDAVPRYTHGDCYRLHLLLKAVFPDAEPWYDRHACHVLTSHDGGLWDITGRRWGASEIPAHVVPWDDVEDHVKADAPNWKWAPALEGGVVDEAMVDRALAAYLRERWGGTHGGQAGDRKGMRAALQAAALPAEMSPEFTDTARAALAWVLYHHQGGSSPVGQPIRLALGMGPHDRLSDQQISEAKRWAAIHGKRTSDFHAALPAAPDSFATHGDSALAHLSNALDDLDSSPDQRPVPLIKEAMYHVRAMLAATPAHDQPEGDES